MRNLGFAAKNGASGQAALVLLISSEVTTLYCFNSLYDDCQVQGGG